MSHLKAMQSAEWSHLGKTCWSWYNRNWC